MVVKGLCDFAAVLRAPHFSHQVVKRPDLLVIEGIGHPSQVGTLRHRGDVNVVRGEEVLRLRAQLGLHVVKWKSRAAGLPGTLSEQRSGPVIHMDIDRPVREYDVGLVLVQQDLRELLVALT